MGNVGDGGGDGIFRILCQKLQQQLLYDAKVEISCFFVCFHYEVVLLLQSRFLSGCIKHKVARFIK